MKKISLILGVTLLLGTASFACDNKKEACCKSKTEVAGKQKTESCGKQESCCKKGKAKVSSASNANNNAEKVAEGAEIKEAKKS